MLRPSRVALLLVLVLVGTIAPGSAAPQPRVAGPGTFPGIQPQVPDPYFPADGNPGYGASTYDIRLRYRFSDGYLSGTAKFLAFSFKDLSSFKTDLLLDVDSVTIYDNAGDEGIEAGFHKTNRHEVVIERPLRNGDPDIVVIKYHGYPGQIAWNGERNWLANRHEVVTMNDTHMAAWWVPTNEHPSDPLYMELRVTTDKSKEVISNGMLVDRRVHGRLATTHWHSESSMAPNLAFFAAGDFNIETGRSGGFTYYNAVSKRLGATARASSMATLRKSATIAKWMREEIGSYPFRPIGGLVTSLDPGFAVSTMTRPTYPANPSKSMLVHELARQWFGGLLRPTQWADVWLSEGFATFLEWYYRADHGGPSTDDVLHRLYRDHRRDGRYWALDLTDPGPKHLFDSRIADRGAMALAALRNVIGPRKMRSVLSYWVQLRQGRHSSTEVFELFLPKAVSFFDIPMTREHIRDFLDAWLHSDRPPPDRPRFGL